MGRKRLDGQRVSNTKILKDHRVKLVIRKAEAADLEQIEELWIQLTDYMHSLDRRHWQRAADGPTKVRQWMEQSLSEAQRVVFVAEKAGTVLGYGHCLLKKGPPPMRPRLEAFITDFVVDEQARGKGIGSKLLEALESWSIAQGAEAITLSVAARNELGRAFWGSKGFEHWTSTMWKPLGKATGGKTPRT